MMDQFLKKYLREKHIPKICPTSQSTPIVAFYIISKYFSPSLRLEEHTWQGKIRQLWQGTWTVREKNISGRKLARKFPNRQVWALEKRIVFKGMVSWDFEGLLWLYSKVYITKIWLFRGVFSPFGLATLIHYIFKIIPRSEKKIRKRWCH
jgi:hypothetical protein